MFASLNKKENIRQRYIRDVRKLLASTFGLSDQEVSVQNETWEEWLQCNERVAQSLNLLSIDAHHLSKFILSDVGDAYKARAIAILFAPEDRLIPFSWRVRKPDYSWLYAEIDFISLSTQLQIFSCAVLEINASLNIAHAERPVGRIVHAFNQFVLSKLVELPEDDALAARLFGQYQLYAKYGQEYDHYRPFQLIMEAGIPEKWKWMADAMMRNLIRARYIGQTQPRDDHDDPFMYYLYPIMTFFLAKLPYSMDLFASQIEFIIGSSSMDDNKLSFLSFHMDMGAVKKLLDDGSHKELCDKLERFCKIIVDKKARDKAQAHKTNAAFHRRQEQEEKLRAPEKNILARMR